MIADWVKDFNVIYKGELYKNCVRSDMSISFNVKPKISIISIVFIDENGALKLIEDEAELFKFVRK